jgi:hypothetical protein
VLVLGKMEAWSGLHCGDFSFPLLVYHGRGMEMVFGLFSTGIRARDRDLHAWLAVP